MTYARIQESLSQSSLRTPLLSPRYSILPEIKFNYENSANEKLFDFLPADIWIIIIQYFIKEDSDLEIIVRLSYALIFYALNILGKYQP